MDIMLIWWRNKLNWWPSPEKELLTMAHLPFFPSIWTERDIQTWDSLDTPTWSIDQPSAWGYLVSYIWSRKSCFKHPKKGWFLWILSKNYSIRGFLALNKPFGQFILTHAHFFNERVQSRPCAGNIMNKPMCVWVFFFLWGAAVVGVSTGYNML